MPNASNLGIRVGAAGNQAATLVAAFIEAGKVTTRQDAIDVHAEMATAILNSLELLEDTAAAAAGITGTFPGTTQATPQEFNAAAAAPAAAAPAPAPVPGASDGDGDPAVAALWNKYFADPSQWWDNRNDKRNPKAPDFKLKSDGNQALWLKDKKNPSWVAARLNGGQAPAPAAPPQPEYESF